MKTINEDPKKPIERPAFVEIDPEDAKEIEDDDDDDDEDEIDEDLIEQEDEQTEN